MGTSSTKSAKRYRCFISAPFGYDVEPVRHVLEELNITAERLDEVAPGEPLIETIQSRIHAADFVCAYFPNTTQSSSTLFELGTAIGAGKPTLVLVEPQTVLPFDLMGLRFVTVDPKNPAVLRIAVRGFIHELGDRPKRVARTPVKHEKLPSPQEAMRDLAALKTGAGSEREFERFIAGLFQRMGYTTAAEAGQSDRGVDIALWVDELDKSLGNPILVEVKARLAGRNRWEAAEKRLRTYLMQARSQCGLLVTRDPLPAAKPRGGPALPFIATFSAPELIRLLADGRFASEVMRRRNLAVHGKLE